MYVLKDSMHADNVNATASVSNAIQMLMRFMCSTYHAGAAAPAQDLDPFVAVER